ncbi:hypothetical protein BJ944DRAFT_238066 [Cunninghamella echinulata]|nr:hypothetical protein BJ944DRAFT_238066 [Cunninghamella echinulata]
MPHSTTTRTTKDDSVLKMILRLKARLALANFKRQHGYEKYDLYTLESNLLSMNPTLSSSLSPTTKSTLLNSYHPYKYYRHRYYPTTTTTIATNKNLSSSPIKKPNSSVRYKKEFIYQSCSLLILKCPPPLSEKRSTSPIARPLSLTINDEDAANLLVMLHNHPSS